MGKHVALLRGINVGRAKRVAMADLRELITGLGYTDVTTHLNSGNVVFGTAGPLEPAAAESIEAALLERTGVQSTVLLVTAEDLLTVVEENPLLDIATDPTRLLVTFLFDPAERSLLTEPDPEALAPDVLRIGTRAVYQWLPGGLLESRLAPTFWKPLGSRTTARNWRTVLRLAELVRDR